MLATAISRHKGKRIMYLLLMVVLFLCLESLLRAILCLHFGISFLHPKDIIYHYYPELRIAEEKYDSTKFNILVLAGSVMYEDTVWVEVDRKPFGATFCKLSRYIPECFYPTDGRPVNVISLAKPAHNSLDSWYKYETLKDYRFDWVIFYHGINDTRANNCPESLFNKDYRHIEFYNEVFVFFRHPEVSVTVIPYTIDLFIQRLLILTNAKKVIPHDFSQQYTTGEAATWYQYGANIKTTQTFERNLTRIIELAETKDEQLVMSTFAFYLPENYALEKFLGKELNYDAQIFPAEIYGLPVNVSKGIEAHNQVIRKMHDLYPKIKFFDFEISVPHNRLYFDDICHLNQRGCEEFATKLSELY